MVISFNEFCCCNVCIVQFGLADGSHEPQARFVMDMIIKYTKYQVAHILTHQRMHPGRCNL